MKEAPAGKMIKLQVNSGKSYLHVVTSFVKHAALAFGMDKKTPISMALASEEIFVYMCSAMEENPVEVTVTDYIFKIAIEFRFKASAVDMKAFNITAKTVRDLSVDNVAYIGLFIAARLVDSFELVENGSGTYTLRIEKEKRYSVPVIDAATFIRPTDSSWTLRTPTKDEVMTQVSMLNVFKNEGDHFPSFLKIPSKVADMFASGLLEAAAACSQGNLPCGMIFWRQISTKAVECFGPYSFLENHGAECSRDLLDYFLNHICKNGVCVVASLYLEEACADGYFEKLTGLSKGLSQTIFYRQINEDSGSAIWISPAIESFVKREKARLFLPRSVIVQDSGTITRGTQGETSVIFTQFDHENMSAIMRPIRFGYDVEENIRTHVELLSSKKYHDIVFELDLGVPWHCLFAETLVGANFQPEFLFPSAGIADVLVMRYIGRMQEAKKMTPSVANGAI